MMELRINRNIIQAFFDNSPFVMLVKDRYGKYIMANKAVYEVVGELIGKTVREFHPEIADEIEANDEKVRTTGEQARTKITFANSEGKEVTHFVIGFPIKNSNGEEGMIGIVDIDIPDEIMEEL